MTTNVEKKVGIEKPVIQTSFRTGTSIKDKNILIENVEDTLPTTSIKNGVDKAEIETQTIEKESTSAKPAQPKKLSFNLKKFKAACARFCCSEKVKKTCKGNKVEFILFAFLITVSALDLGFLVNAAYFTQYFMKNLTFSYDQDYVIYTSAVLYLVYSLLMVIVMILGFIACFKKSESLKFILSIKIYLTIILNSIIFDLICGIISIVYGVTQQSTSASISTFLRCAGSFYILFFAFKIPVFVILYKIHFFKRK